MNQIIMKNVHSEILKLIILVLFILLIQSCGSVNRDYDAKILAYSLEGRWVKDIDSEFMLNPQTSGLTYYKDHLYSISDGSAHSSQIKRLHKIDPDTASVIEKQGPFKLADSVKSTCFASYLTTRPDYEGLVAIPNQADTWLTVTEDATRAGQLSSECREKFKDTYSTEHPTLLVKLELINDDIFVTGIRAIQFSASDNVGNFPNDGIEGITITRDYTLLLGLEKDANTKARLFKVKFTDQMFNKVDEFLKVQSLDVDFPAFESGNHPINGMDVYYPDAASAGYLIAAARNDDQLWIVDLTNNKPAKILQLNFYAPSPANSNCEPLHKIKNTALEGVAVHNEILYLINDPWKKVYPDNVICASDKQRYEEFAPLIFELPIDEKWFR